VLYASELWIGGNLRASQPISSFSGRKAMTNQKKELFCIFVSPRGSFSCAQFAAEYKAHPNLVEGVYFGWAQGFIGVWAWLFM
jgi:hypothetical protein